ncbi:PREDICTED: disease resistance protein RRS1-like [Camelina sativa]|uniref:Disease resistance protein RRS1-like n=1 Tax=Camelina sativa TaxID=90675 RepID=A0ABM0X6W3_CAMSA|nr:PREDICTED: disease resistance protein RRS1-like [Camelina sativa]
MNELRKRAIVTLQYDLVNDTETRIQDLNTLYGVFILLFSKNYASAESLDKLVTLMEYQKANGVLIIPVFLKVTPSEVHDPKGFVEATFSQLGNSVQGAGRVQKWKEAINELAHTDDCKWIAGGKSILPEEIVRYACLRLFSISSQNVTRMYSLLNSLQTSDTQMVGIWGMPGIGKTSVAREIFRRLAPGYDSCYFLQDFHLMYQTKGLSNLRDELFSKLFGEEKLVIDACDTKPSFMKNRFQNKTVLVVIDDVSNARDAEALVGGFDWFSGGHLIILTSRNRQVLVQCKVKELYEIQKLSQSESSQILSLSLLGQYESMLNSEFVRYASGIPLVLRVLGMFATNKCTVSEKEQLQMLRQSPPTEIMDAFRRSFDGLNENEKNIFLDLACFFRGENRNHVTQILDGCSYFTDLGIYSLIDEYLIEPLDDKIEMSNVFQDMGRFVVCEESKEPGRRSRLWDANEITEVLTNNSGTVAVEGIFLDMSNLTCELSPTIFARTYRLRLLKLHCSTSGNRGTICLPRGLYSLPDELQLLHWESYPLRSLPRSFNPKKLVELNMPNSKIEKLWKGTKNLEKLKKIVLSHSRQLIKIPRLSKALNLEHIDLEGCTSLVKVSSSIHHLSKLVFLNLKDCSRLRSLPAMIDIETLEVLNLSGCSDLKEIQDFSPNLKELYLAGTAIKVMPSSIENLTRLTTLDLENCNQLLHLPPGISNLKAIVTLKLSGCSSLKSLPNLDSKFLRGLERLNTETTKEVPEPLVRHSAIQKSRLDDCEIIDKLQLRSDIPDSCLNNSAIQESVATFVYPKIGGIQQPKWPWSTTTLQLLSMFHFLGSRLYALVSLCLSNACLVDIPKDISELPSLNTLDLSENGFSKIPESIKLLPKLHSLRLRHCKNLKSLPELPQSLVFLNVHGCVSMKSVPWSFERLHCTFSNCFNLSPEDFRRFLAKALGIVKIMNREQHQKLITVTAFRICAPASVSLKCSTDVLAPGSLKSSVQKGSSAMIQLTSSLRKTFLGFAMSVVVSFRDNYYSAAGFSIRCTCIRKMMNGLSHKLEKVFQFWGPKEASKIQNDHIFFFYDAIIHFDVRIGKNRYIFDDLLEFEFRPVNSQNEVLADSCEVKNCGVYVIADASGDTSLVKKRFTPTKRERSGKRLIASAMDPRGFSSHPEPQLRFKRGRYRKSVESAILKIRKRKRD